MSCPRCDSTSNGEAFICSKCNSPLWDAEAPLPEDGERFLHLVSACENMRSGSWDLGTFHQFVEAFAAELALREKAIRELEIPSELEADFADEQEVGFDGIQHCNDAVKRLRVCDGDTDALQESLELFYRGVCLVKEAMQINRRNRDRPIWS